VPLKGFRAVAGRAAGGARAARESLAKERRVRRGDMG